MRKLLFVTLAGVVFSSSALAYSVKHSYSARGNATEFYGKCDNGKKFKIIKQADGVFLHDVGGDTVKLGKTGLDGAARIACGE